MIKKDTKINRKIIVSYKLLNIQIKSGNKLQKYLV